MEAYEKYIFIFLIVEINHNTYSKIEFWSIIIFVEKYFIKVIQQNLAKRHF